VLLLLLLAVGVGAGVLGPGLVGVGPVERPRIEIVRPSPATSRPEAHGPPRLEPSLGPVLDLIERSLNREAFDLRRPVRIPSRPDPPPGGDRILLADPVGTRPGLLPPRSRAPGPRRVAALSLPPPAFTDPTTGLPTGGPHFDRELVDDDTPPAEPGVPFQPPVSVPEPALVLLLGSAGLALGRRRRATAR